MDKGEERRSEHRQVHSRKGTKLTLRRCKLEMPKCTSETGNWRAGKETMSRSLSWGKHSKREAGLLPELWLGWGEESRAQQTESLLEAGMLESCHWQELHIRV